MLRITRWNWRAPCLPDTGALIVLMTPGLQAEEEIKLVGPDSSGELY